MTTVTVTEDQALHEITVQAIRLLISEGMVSKRTMQVGIKRWQARRDNARECQDLDKVAQCDEVIALYVVALMKDDGDAP